MEHGKKSILLPENFSKCRFLGFPSELLDESLENCPFKLVFFLWLLYISSLRITVLRLAWWYFPWTARRSNQSILKETSPGYSLEGLMLKLKLQYFGHLMRRVLIGKDSDAGRDWGQKEKGTTEDEMAGWHHRLNGHGFGWTLGVGDGQGGMASCGSWGLKSRTRLSDWTELNWCLKW